MATYWTSAGNISQYAEEGADNAHISWSNIGTEPVILNDKFSIVTSKNLYHIARSPKHDLMTKTFFLKLTDFRFQNLPATISGVELRIMANRRGRIVDDTVQLLLNGQLIGDNKAGSEISVNKIYGSSTELWNSSLTADQIAQSSFGVLLRFKSHPKWPHSDPMFVNCVELRIH